MEAGSESSPEITVAPVVVSPDRDSNTASVRDRLRAPDSRNGRQPTLPSTAQNRVTTRKPSLALSSRRLRAAVTHSTKPMPN